MKKSLFLAAILLISLALCATVEISGDARTRMSWNNWFDPDSDSKSIFDSRAQIQFKVNPAEDLYFVYMLRAGNYVWGDKANTGVWSKEGKLVTRHLYFDYNGFEDMNIRVGLLPWLDHKSLVLDDDLAGVIVSKKFNQDMTLEVGYGQLYESDTAFDGPNDYNDADVDAFLGLISFDMSNMYGVNTIIKSYKINKSRLDLWFMPYFNYNLNGLQIDAMGAYNYGSYTEAFEGKDVTNGGYAFSLDLEYNLEENGIAGLNFLYSSGDDGEDPESTTAFNILSSYYMNGLEYMGIGINDSHPSDFNFDANNKDAGIMSIVGRYAYPFTEKFTGRIAAGMVSAVEGEETAMATEINIGACYMLYENVSLDAVGAYVMPGEYYQFSGEDGDNVYEVSTRINVKF